MEDKMTDIVEELRQGSLNKDDYRWKAADEIERLRALEKAGKARKKASQRLARAALEEPK
jgi:hypothetical protein